MASKSPSDADTPDLVDLDETSPYGGSLLPIHQIEESNRRLQRENEALHRRLMNIANGKDTKQLSRQVEMRRQQLQDMRLKQYVERAVDFQTNHYTLKSTIKAVTTGRDVKHLSREVESKRQQLAFYSLEKFATDKLNQHSQDLEFKSRLDEIQTGRDSKALSDEIETKRRQLLVERVQNAQRREEQLRMENEQLRSRLQQAVGKDSKALGDEVESRRQLLVKEKMIQRLEREEIIKAENQVHKLMLERAKTDPSYHQYHHLQSQDEDGIHVISVPTEVTQRSLDERRSQFFERRRMQSQQKQQMLQKHKADHRRILKETTSGRDKKALDDTIEHHRQLLADKRRNDQELHKLELQQNQLHLKSLTSQKYGRDTKSLSIEVEAYRSQLRKKRLEDQRSHQLQLQQHKARLRSIIRGRGSGGRTRTRSSKHRLVVGSSRLGMASSSHNNSNHKIMQESTEEQTRQGVATAPKVTLLTHGILVKDNTVKSNANVYQYVSATSTSGDNQQSSDGTKIALEEITDVGTKREAMRLQQRQKLEAENRAFKQRLASVESPCRQMIMKKSSASPSIKIVSPSKAISTGSPTSVMDPTLIHRVNSSQSDECAVGNEDRPARSSHIHPALSVSMKRLQIAEKTHQQLQKHNTELLERLAKASSKSLDMDEKLIQGDGEIEEDVVFFDC